jgi:hypothetical protein
MATSTALVRRSDVVTAFFERLGNLGVLLIAGALLAGGLAGSAITHHYDRTSSNPVASEQKNDKVTGGQKPAKNKGQGKQKHPNKSPKPATPVAPEQPETD